MTIKLRKRGDETTLSFRADTHEERTDLGELLSRWMVRASLDMTNAGVDLQARGYFITHRTPRTVVLEKAAL